MPRVRASSLPSVVILVYHHVAPAAPAQTPAEEGWSWRHTPDQLELHIAELRRRGRQIVSLDEYVDDRPKAAVVLTFDDGWADNYEVAVPVLRSLDAPATFFLTTDHLSGERPDPRRMTPEQVRELDGGLFTFGGHTRTHQALTRLEPGPLESEVAGCRSDLTHLLSQPPRWFAYPGGAFDSRCADAVRSAGWDGALCSLAPARNTPRSRYWMFRDVPGSDLRSRRDRARLSPATRRLWGLRTRQRLRRHLRAR